jgi:serine/threonine protein phosphatase PrpC
VWVWQIKGKTIYCANAGDSRAVMCRSGKAINLSDDHKPMDEVEKQRIEKANGFVEDKRYALAHVIVLARTRIHALAWIY